MGFTATYPRHEKPPQAPALEPDRKVDPCTTTTIALGISVYGYRYYEPGTGRWLSRDPEAEVASNILYSFVSNNPVILLDKLGLFPILPEPASEFTDLDLRNLPARDPFGANSSLDFETTDFYELDCGLFRWATRWKIDPPGDVGAIVQQVTRRYVVYDCNGNEIANLKSETGKPLNQKFREGWLVYPREGITSDAQRAMKANPDRREHWDDVWVGQQFPGTCGFAIFIGSAQFFEGSLLPKNVVPNNPHTDAGRIRSTTDSPDKDLPRIDGAASNVVTRTLVVSWNCCGGKKESTVNRTPNQ